MDNANYQVFSKNERHLLNGILQGRQSGAPIARRLAKIRKELAKSRITILDDTIAQKLYWKTNDQPFWRAVYAVAAAERPSELTQAFAEEKKGAEKIC